MPYPLHSEYRGLYARYFEGTRTEQLIGLAGPLAGKRVADLCGGGGRLALLAQAQGAQVTLVDESAAMATAVPPGIPVQTMQVGRWLSSYCGGGEIDVMFCQQAVNYWLTPELAREVGEVLVPGGQFIFNTFNKKPSRAPVVKQYALEGVCFAEASWLTGTDTVEHVQMRENEPPHTTRFRWITPEQFRQWLAPCFDLQELVEGASTVWVCTRRQV